MATFDDNVRLLGELFGNQEYSERGAARTSRLDANEQPEADPSNGLPAGYIWVRREGSRSGVRALIGAGLYRWERIGNLPIEVGINRSGELEAIKPLVNIETNYTHAVTLTTAPAQSLYIDSKQVTPGLVTADAVGGYGLSVYVQPLAYRDTVIQGAVSVSSSVPGSAGQRRLAVIYYDVSAAALGVVNGTATTSATPFTIDDAVAIALGDTDRIRLGAVELVYGQTSVTASNHFIDCRDWLTLHVDSSSTSLPNFGAGVIKTLASDVASAGSDRHLILAAQSSTTDNLIEITGLSVGDEVIIRADSGDTITVKHNDAGATDKILLYNAADLALSGDMTLKLVKTASGKVVQYVDEKGSGSAVGDWIVIREKQTAGTYGGAFTSGADRTRVLNEELVDTGNHASLSSNQITLAAGTYRFEIKCPAFFVGQHVAWLYDVTNTADVEVGTAEYSNPTNGSMNSSVIVGRVTIAGSTVFEVRHRCQTTKTVDGFGTASGFKAEIYTVAQFWKE